MASWDSSQRQMRKPHLNQHLSHAWHLRLAAPGLEHKGSLQMALSAGTFDG